MSDKFDLRVDNLVVGATSTDSDVLTNVNGTLAITNSHKFFPKELDLEDDVATTYITFNLPALNGSNDSSNIGAEISYAITTNRTTSSRVSQTTYGKLYIAIARHWVSSEDSPVTVTLVDTDKSLALAKSGGSDPTITWASNITGGTDESAKTVEIILTVDNPASGSITTRINGLTTAHINTTDGQGTIS